MRDEGRDGCLRVLGLAPGASAQEVKAAYRDLAKVWHPDRFAHDPRLQQKAQEQLKEINEAYGRLVSGDFATPHARHRASARPEHEQHAPRAADTPPWTSTSDTARDDSRETRAATAADERVATRPRRNMSRVALAAPALAFCATFALVTPRLLSTTRAPEQPDDAGAISAPARDAHGESPGQPPNAGAETAEAKDARAQQKNQQQVRQHTNEATESSVASAAQPVRALATVTVSVDPTTGLRARSGCPNKTAMTFPAGDEPSAYCDAHDAPAPQRASTDNAGADKTGESRKKSFAERLASPAKKLFGGRGAPDKGAAGEKSSPRD